jgi:hypothetical protein
MFKENIRPLILAILTSLVVFSFIMPSIIKKSLVKGRLI